MARIDNPIVIRSLGGTRMTITLDINARISLWLRMRIMLAMALLRVGAWLVDIEVVNK